MIGYGFHSEAATELEAAMDFYEAEKLELGREFLDEVVRTISRITQYPDAAPRVSHRGSCHNQRNNDGCAGG